MMMTMISKSLPQVGKKTNKLARSAEALYVAGLTALILMTGLHTLLRVDLVF